MSRRSLRARPWPSAKSVVGMGFERCLHCRPIPVDRPEIRERQIHARFAGRADDAKDRSDEPRAFGAAASSIPSCSGALGQLGAPQKLRSSRSLAGRSAPERRPDGVSRSGRRLDRSSSMAGEVAAGSTEAASTGAAKSLLAVVAVQTRRMRIVFGVLPSKKVPSIVPIRRSSWNRRCRESRDYQARSPFESREPGRCDP